MPNLMVVKLMLRVFDTCSQTPQREPLLSFSSFLSDTAFEWIFPYQLLFAYRNTPRSPRAREREFAD